MSILKPTLDAKQLAEVLHLKAHTVTDYVLSHPEWLPPFVRLPSEKPYGLKRTSRLGSRSAASRSCRRRRARPTSAVSGGKLLAYPHDDAVTCNETGDSLWTNC